MELWQLLLLATVGVVSGWVNVLAGGGSVLTLPVMILMGIPGPLANGTNRIGILVQNLAACSTFLTRGYADWRLGLGLALSSLPGAIMGAWIGTSGKSKRWG